MLRHYTLILCVLLSLATPAVCQEIDPPFTVCFVAIATPEENFWSNIIAMSQAAADDLNIDLEIIYANRNHIKAVEIVKQISARPVKPDYLIVVGEKKIGGQSLALADKAGIKTILFGTLTPAEHAEFGSPRGTLSHWIGQRTIDDYGLGKETAQTVIQHALDAGLTDSEGQLNMLGLAGVKATSFSDERVRGLRDAVAENNRVNLLQVVSTDWTKANSQQISSGLLRRYSRHFNRRIGAIWAANGQISLGAIAASQEMGFKPGQDFITSGIDWESEVFTAIQQESMLTVAGGHFAEVAWIMVMLYDYQHGLDFIHDKQTSTSFQLNRDNIAAYLRIFEKKNWHQIDFTKFSKTYHPEIKQYQFSFDTIMKQFNQ